jgi:hypothetical protein
MTQERGKGPVEEGSEGHWRNERKEQKYPDLLINQR